MADETTPQELNDELLLLEGRKVKALERIANVLDALTLWFEDIDKNEQKRSEFLDDLECFTDKKNISYRNECEDEENSDGKDD